MSTLFALVRFAHFASLMTVFGASALLTQMAPVDRLGRTLDRPRLVAAAIAFVTGGLWFLFVAVEMSGGAFDGDVLARVLLATSFGHVAAWRFALLAWLCWLCIGGSEPFKTAVSGIALLLLAFTSHAAALGEPPPHYVRVAVDAAHVLAAGFWTGGLAVLAREVLATPRDTPHLIRTLKLFSRGGAIAVAVLVAAGILNGVFILGAGGRWSNAYVTLLAFKIVLAAMMVGLALTNRFGVLPGLERGDKEADETVPLTVVAELSCAVLILVIVGFLGVAPPMQM